MLCCVVVLTCTDCLSVPVVVSMMHLEVSCVVPVCIHFAFNDAKQ